MVAITELRRGGNASVLPGFGLSLGITFFSLATIVLVPLAALAIRPWSLGFSGFVAAVTTPRVLAALALSFGGAAIAASINAVLGFVVAWTLTRYRFPGKRVFDALVDLPFALPTAVAGVALSALYAENGWLGEPLSWLGIKVAYTPAGVIVALIFIGLPFVVRTLQPVIAEMGAAAEEAAATLGAAPLQTFRRVILPALAPALLSGVGMAWARGVGEYGSVIFIAGNLPMKSEIAPLLIVMKLEQFDYAGAAAIGLVMLLCSFIVILAMNFVQSRLLARG